MDLVDIIDKERILPAPKPDSKFWHDVDNKELYKKNLKEQSEEWYYRKKIVVYTSNSDGYRTKEFKTIDWKNSVVVFGCSHVYGIGNAEDDTITAQLESIIGYPVINMGVPGSSSTFAVHNAAILSRSYPTPKAVINVWTSPFRCPYYNKDNLIHCGDWFRDSVRMSDSWNKTIQHPISVLKLNSILSKELWERRTKYYEITLFPITSENLHCDLILPVDKARDMIHYGKQTNLLVAQKIANNIDISR